MKKLITNKRTKGITVPVNYFVSLAVKAPFFSIDSKILVGIHSFEAFVADLKVSWFELRT